MTNKSQTQQSMEQDPRKFQIECVLEEHSNLLSVSTPDQSGSHPNLAGSIKKKIEVAKVAREAENVKAAAETPTTASGTLIVIYALVTKLTSILIQKL